jgi:hypothetical protein
MKKFLKYALFIFGCFCGTALIVAIATAAMKLIAYTPTASGQLAGLVGFWGLVSLIAAGVICVIERW